MSQAITSDVILRQSEHTNEPRGQNKTGQVLLMTTILSLATIHAGYTIAYIAGLGPTNLALVYGNNTSTPIVKGFLVAFVPFGIMFGTLISPFVIRLATRRNLTTILCLFALGLIGIIQIQSLTIFFIVRFFQGTESGLFLVLIPVYIKQICPKQLNTKIRFGIFQKLFVLFGLLLPFSFNTIMLRKDTDEQIRWRILVSINGLPVLILLILILVRYVPQSPNSLIQKERDEQAKQVIARFYPQDCIEEVFDQKVRQVQILNNAPQLVTPPKENRSKLKIFLTFSTPITHQLTGINAVLSQMGFVVSFFYNDFSQFIPLLTTSVQLLTGILSMAYVPKCSSRVIILVGNLSMSLCNFAIGISLLTYGSNSKSLWVAVAFLIVFVGMNGGTFIPAVGLYVATVGGKHSIRWSLVTNWFMCGWTIVIFVIIGDKFGFDTIFFVYGITSMVCFVFNLFGMIQTKPNLDKHPSIQLKSKQKT